MLGLLCVCNLASGLLTLGLEATDVLETTPLIVVVAVAVKVNAAEEEAADTGELARLLPLA